MGGTSSRSVAVTSILMANVILASACGHGTAGVVVSGSPSPQTSVAQPSPSVAVGRDILAVIEVGGEPVDVATGFGSMWVIDNANGSVARISPRTNAVAATIELPKAHPGGLAVAGDGVWVIDDRDPYAWRIDAATNHPTPT